MPTESPCRRMRPPQALTGAAVLMLILVAVIRPAAAAGEKPAEAIGFVAMGGDRFAAAYSAPDGTRGLVVRFAKGQFSTEDTAEIDFGVGYPELTYDPVSDTLLLCRAYEDASCVIAYAPEGRELHRLRTGESTEAIADVPGAGLLAIGNRGALTLVECRTGVTLRQLTLTGTGGRIDSVTALDDDQLLVHCQEDGGAEYVLLDWRAGLVLWRRPAEPHDWGGRCRVAADSTRIFTLISRIGSGGATIASRRRADGAALASADLPVDWCWLFAVPGDPRLLLLTAGHQVGARLQLLDPVALQAVAEVAWPAGLRVEYLQSARDLGGGRVLLDGRFTPDPGPLARQGRTCRQVLVDLAAAPAGVRALDEPLAVDPDGRSWVLGSRNLEVVGEVPWVEAIELDAPGARLPSGVRRHRREVAFGGGRGHTVRQTFGAPRTGDAAELRELLERADLCFTGTIATTSTHCLADGSLQEGLVSAEFTVDELLWGPAGYNYVYVDGVDLPGCVEHTPARLPDLARFVPGRRYLVAARWIGDAFVVRGRGVFALDADATSEEEQGGFGLPEPATIVREFAARIDPATQMERADAVVRLGAIENRGLSIAGLVSEVYKGDEALCRVEVWAERGGSGWLARLENDGRSGGRGDADPVLFLRRCGPGRYELLEGERSVLLRGRDGVWARPSGLREGRAAAAMDRSQGP